MILYGFLQFGEGHAIEGYTAAVVRELLAELLHLEQCTVRGIGRAHVVYGSDVNSPLCHHIACNRAVDTA